MDNVTHGLIGLLVAEVLLVARFRGKETWPPGYRGAALVTSIAANNTPDLDFVYSGITEGKLGYLLHHRGHTHTLLAALPMALLALLPVIVWTLTKRPRWSRSDYGWLGGLSLLGPLLHVGMDAMNNYGVHPFWPFDNRWVYGDAVFIVEPTFFVVLCVLLGWECRTRTARWLLGGLVVAVLGLCWGLSAVTIAGAAGLTAGAAALWWLGRGATRRVRVLGAFGLFLGWLAVFVGGRRLMADQLQALLNAQTTHPHSHDTRTHALVLTPLPANPLCWSFLVVQTEGADYLVRRGQAALAPSWIPAEACPRFSDEGTTAQLRPVALAEGARVQWRGEFRMPLARLQTLGAQHCAIAALLRFARVPFVEQVAEDQVIVGDLRYDREAGLGFAEVEFALPQRDCPSAVPPWVPPRADLLEPPVR
jgi:inner membrane protein